MSETVSELVTGDPFGGEKGIAGLWGESEEVVVVCHADGPA